MAGPQRQQDLRPPIKHFLESLRTKLQIYAVKGPDEEERTSFVPRSEAKKYLEEGNPTRLSEILTALFAPDGPPFDPDTVLDKYVAVLCILVELGKGECIADLVQHDYNDHRLGFPFDPNQEPAWWPPDTRDGDFYKRFCQKQWRFCPAIFERKLSRVFEVDCILPILKKERLDRGGSATLHKIRLHGSYNHLLPNNAASGLSEDLRNTFALKTYFGSEAKQHYETELEGFRKLKVSPNQQDQHIIGFYGAYTQGDSYNIILEYADQGSLEDFFGKTSPPHARVHIARFWTGLFGILKGLDSIHNIERSSSGNFDSQTVHGWHQDVKPRNILVISNGAHSPYEFKFKLADLGDCHFQTTFGGGRTITALDTRGTQTYAAPECFRSDNFWDYSNLEVKQNVDIWSLGCVFSEAAVWMAKEYGGVLSYRDARSEATERISKRLGDCFHDGEKVLKTVSHWHHSLPTALRACDDLTPKVWKMVDEHMLLQSSEARLGTRQLSYRAQSIVSDAVASGSSLSSITASDGTESASQQPPELPPSDRAPPPPDHRRTNSDGVDTSPWQKGKERRSNSSIIIGPLARSPDVVSEFQTGEGLGLENAYDSRAVNGRSTSQLFDSRQVVDHTSYSQNQRRSAISDQDAAHRRQLTRNTWRHETADQKPRHQRGISGQSQSTHSTARESSVHFEDDNLILDDSSRQESFLQSAASNQFREDTSDKQKSPQLRRSHGNNHSSLPSSPPFEEFSPKKPSSSNNDPLRSNPLVFAKPEASISSKARAALELPHLAIGTALAWRDDKKYNEAMINRFNKRPERELPGEWLFDQVGKRDHVFILDDVIGMIDHWDELCILFGILAYLVKRSDKDGIDMYFTSSDKQYNDKNTSKLVETAKKRKIRGRGNINNRLEDILGGYNKLLRNQVDLRHHHSIHAPKEDLKPLSIYVLTDGVWTPKSNPKLAIERIVESLVALKAPSSQVGIQFIRFGNDANGRERLEHYDFGLGLKRDIVDHTPSNGNLWKMVMGAIDPDYDGDTDEEDAAKARKDNG